MARPELPEPSWSTHDRPWLVPWNRRLRHLRSVAVRNLSSSVQHGRTRARSNDDEALPHSLQTPGKLLALAEERVLVHSRSSGDLRDKRQVNETYKVPVRGKKTRPEGLKLRRQSTLDWASASPQTRQKRLEDVSAARLADVFFSLHVSGVKHPIYVSETVSRTMNPTFQSINIEDCGPSITRLDQLSIKLWVRHSGQQGFVLLEEMSLSLRSLQFIGRKLASFNQPFPENCILFELSDGFYTCFTDARGEEATNPFLDARSRLSGSRSLPTASFDALLRLSKLDDNIQDALALRRRLSTDLSALADSKRQALIERDQVLESKDYSKTIEFAKSTLEKQLKNLRHSHETRKAALERRRGQLAHGSQSFSNGATETTPEDLSQLRSDMSRLQQAITNQRRRIGADLGAIYPIAAIPNKTLAFKIRGIHLPDSEALEGSPPDELAAALGYVAHVLQLLAFYLRHPLPYPVHPRLSTSLMTDPISSLKQQRNGPANSGPYPKSAPRSLSDPSRTFSLSPRSSGPRYRFEYALFLLNKDLHVLLSDAFGVHVLDIRQTLPNLMYVLACMAAGEGELPSRKAGGIRGLMKTSTAQNQGREGLGVLGGIAMKQGALSATTTLIGSLDSDEEDFKRLRRTARNIYRK